MEVKIFTYIVYIILRIWLEIYFYTRFLSINNVYIYIGFFIGDL